MAKNQNKTQPTREDVRAFVASVEHPVRRRDAERLVALMERVSGEPPRMWGSSMVGFGSYHYRYESGREGDAAVLAFAPRKPASTIYLMNGVEEHAELLARLGPHTTGKGCLYVKDLEWVDIGVLEEILRRTYAELSGPGDFGKRLSGRSTTPGDDGPTEG